MIHDNQKYIFGRFESIQMSNFKNYRILVRSKFHSGSKNRVQVQKSYETIF